MINLNEQQAAAVKADGSHILVLAGAGSGKTRVLTERVVHLLRQRRVPSSEILVLTFTRKAYEEMRRRITESAGSCRHMWIGTFHSICVRVLQEFGSQLGYSYDFSIYDEHDQEDVYKAVISDLGLTKQVKIKEIIRMRMQKLAGAEMPDDRYQVVQAEYGVRLREANAIDFDGLLFETIRLWKENPDILRHYQDRFKYVLIDENQDTNDVQYEMIVRTLAPENLFVVGDDYQAIYRFRGSNVQIILDFPEYYPDAQVFKLEQNYRSTKPIIEAANAVIGHNQHQFKKNLWTDRDGEPVTVNRGELNSAIEAVVIAKIIQKRTAGRGYTAGDFAVLYRTHNQARAFTDEFDARQIPYTLVSRERELWDREEARIIASYMAVVNNPNDNFRFRRIINVPHRGIGQVSLATAKSIQVQQDLNLYEALEKVDSGGIQELYEVFNPMIHELHTPNEGCLVPAVDLAERIITDTNLKDFYDHQGLLHKSAGLDQVLAFIKSWSEDPERGGPNPSTQHFLEWLSLKDIQDAIKEEEDTVRLMTIHAAKGLEFKVVFVVGLEEGLFPLRQTVNCPDDLEEERRLFYVAITRAKDELHLYWAIVRRQYGRTSQSQQRSRFIAEACPWAGEPTGLL